MPKNGQNDLKFGHHMYCDHFYPFFKFCQNLSKNGALAFITTLVWAKIPLEAYNFAIYLLDTIGKSKDSYITY